MSGGAAVEAASRAQPPCPRCRFRRRAVFLQTCRWVFSCLFTSLRPAAACARHAMPHRRFLRPPAAAAA